MVTSEGPAAGFCRSTAYRMSNLTVDLVELTLILMIPVCQPNSDLAYDGNLADGQDRWWNIIHRNQTQLKEQMGCPVVHMT